jgi:predicted nucleotidyltransferase
VYGSYARGTQKKDSDIDICVLVDAKFVNRYDEALNRELKETLKKDVHCVFCLTKNHWCVKEIYNKNQDEVVKSLSSKKTFFTRLYEKILAWIR